MSLSDCRLDAHRRSFPIPHRQPRLSQNTGPFSIINVSTPFIYTSRYKVKGRSGLAVACLTAVREVLGSNRAVGSCVYRTTTVIYSLGHGLCTPFLQCLGQLSLPPSVGR